MICQVSSNAISRSEAEWLEYLPIVVEERGGRVGLRSWQPPLRQKFSRFVKVSLRMEGGKLMDPDSCLKEN